MFLFPFDPTLQVEDIEMAVNLIISIVSFLWHTGVRSNCQSELREFSPLYKDHPNIMNTGGNGR